jgi:hypothetical protein
MPDITMQATLTVNKSSSMLRGVGACDITQATSTKRNNSAIQSVPATGTSAVALAIGSVSPLGYLFVKNLGAGTVSLGLTATGGPPTVVGQVFATLRAGECCLLPAANATMYAQVTTGSAGDIMVVAAEP